MQERQVTIGGESYSLDKPFLVMATQNPVEQEGTYPLPEAQVDRFMLKVVIDYPKKEEEKMIIRHNLAKTFPTANTVVTIKEIIKEQTRFVRFIWTKRLSNTLLILYLLPGILNNTD